MKRSAPEIRISDIEATCCHPDCYADPVPEAPVPLCVGHLAEVVRYFHAEAGTRYPGLQLIPEPPLARQPRSPGVDVVYFVRLADRIKVGTTADLRRRLTELPHDEVLLVLPGGRDVEAEWHARLDAHRLTGEWFRASPACLAVLAQAG